MPQTSHIPASLARWLCQRLRGSQSSSASLCPCPAVLPPIPGQAVPARLADGAQLQAQAATAADKVFTAKGPNTRIWQGMICGSRAAPSTSVRLPKAWARQDLHGGILVQQEPIAPCMHLGCFLCFITSFHFLLSLWINNRPMCGHELYPLRAVSYKATGHAQQQLGLPHVPRLRFFKKKHLQGSYGEGMLLPFKCACVGVCAHVGVVLITHSLEINSASYAMIDEALSTGCGLLDGKHVGATWISLTQQPPVLSALLMEMLDPGYSFIVGYLPFNFL